MIHFSHGNGFPAETYNQVIKELKEYTDVGYISCMGHNPEYPVVNNWSNLVDELLDHIIKHYKEPIIGIGHSFGGVISYYACARKPELFKAVLLLDSPIYTSWKLRFISLIKALGLVEYITPARSTRTRRVTWPSYQACLEHFATKKVFKYFDKRCLEDYVYYGTELVSANSTEVRLRFDRMIEWKIYKTLPLAIMPKLPNNIPCGLIYGRHSQVVTREDARKMAEDYGVWTQRIDKCGHLFPFEQPDETTANIIQFIKGF